MEEGLDSISSILGIIIFFAPFITAFVVVTFTPIRRLRQPTKFLAVGIASGVVGAFFSVISMLRGTITSRAVLFIVGISTVGGALISLLFSSETITEKKRDELVRKSDDQSWRVP